MAPGFTLFAFSMPQLQQPYSYLGEWIQLSAVAALVLALVTYTIIPATTLNRMALVLLSARKASPLEQFSASMPPALAYFSLTLVGL